MLNTMNGYFQTNYFGEQAWGIRHITFLDGGHVSFSNPVRQNLFTYSDAEKKREKAKAAAFRVKEIHPGLVVNGYKIHIPMPGYTIGESFKDQTIQALNQIEELFQSHDVIYLLTDSRESRWLPTMLAATHDKVRILMYFTRKKAYFIKMFLKIYLFIYFCSIRL